MRRRTKKRLLIISLIIILGLCTGLYFTKANKDYIKPLTSKEKLEDFEYMYNFIADNYPFLKVNERVNGVDWLGKKEEFKKIIENAPTDSMFESEITKIISQLNNSHTDVLGGMSYPFFYSLYADTKYEYMFKPWFDVLNNEKVLKRYKFDEKELEVYKEDKSHGPDVPYCKTDIIIPNEVAYLKIQQMNSERIEKDGIIIREFLEEVKDYDKLIIDIRGNLGGNDWYWMNNVVKPLINDKITSQNYIFVRGDYAKYFYEHRNIEFSPVSKIDRSSLDSFPKEIEEEFSYYYMLTRTYEPVDPVGFNGKIYLIVDKWVYSSAESFAAFSKDSGFATLVGSITGGDGIGLDPLFFSLPNSGLVIRLSGDLALNGDGTINEEVHTTPDIVIDPTIGSTYERDKAIQYIINN